MTAINACVREAAWQVLDRVTAHRKKLLVAGFEPIPVNGKTPVETAWQATVASIDVIDRWSRELAGATNTGILTKHAPAVDIDVHDASVADEIQGLAWKLISEGARGIVRFGQVPKRAVLFRTDKPFAKLTTPVFVSPDGMQHRVEVLCDGQQIVVHGVHPTTGGPYTWLHGEPGEVKRADLPLLTADMAAGFIADATACLIGHGWRAATAAPVGISAISAISAPASAGKVCEFDQLYGDHCRRFAKYASVALDGCTAELAAAAEGSRNDTLNKLAFRMGSMIVNGWIDRGRVHDRLLAAALTCGLGEREARQTLKGALAAGEQAPCKAPDDMPLSGSAEAGDGQTAYPWDDPDQSILDDRRGVLPSLPVEAMPANSREWIERSARGAGVTPGHVVIPLLAIASGLIGTSRRIQASSSWSEPFSLWTAVVGFSGTGKTPGLDVTKRPLSQIERDRKEKIAELRRNHDTKVEAARAAHKNWKDSVKAAIESQMPAPPMPPQAAPLEEFISPRLYVSNATIERIAVLLQARPGGMLVIADELAGLFLNMSRYSSGQDNEFWLEAYMGKHFVVERMGRPAVVLDYLLVGITGGFQPDKLSKSFKNDEDGMYARILFGWPEEPNYNALSDDVSEDEPEIRNSLNRLVNLLCGEVFVPKHVRLSDEARFEFEQFRQFLHTSKDGFDGREREWRAKGATHVLRLAGTLAYLCWSLDGGEEPQSINAEFMRSAVRLWREYFWPHSQAALRQAGLNERHANARRVMRWIKAKGMTEVSREDIRRTALSQQLDVEQTQALIDGLVKAGWLRPKPSERASKGGRPALRWEVNPTLQSTAEIAEIAETPSEAPGDIVSAFPAICATSSQAQKEEIEL